MNPEYFIAAVAGAAISGIAFFYYRTLEEKRLAKMLELSGHLAPTNSYEARESFGGEADFLVRTEEDELKFQWKPMFGDAIELGATGFLIRLEPNSHRPFHPYKLYSPEGRCILDGAEGSLEDMKKLGESMAKDRSCFAYTPTKFSAHLPSEKQ